MFFMISGYFLYRGRRKTKEKSRWVCAPFRYVYAHRYCVLYNIDQTSVGWFFTTIFYEGNSPLFHFFILNAPMPYYTVGTQIWFLIAQWNWHKKSWYKYMYLA
jgi:hypothetical protein